jgi:hypothetical protein
MPNACSSTYEEWCGYWESCLVPGEIYFISASTQTNLYELSQVTWNYIITTPLGDITNLPDDEWTSTRTLDALENAYTRTLTGMGTCGGIDPIDNCYVIPDALYNTTYNNYYDNNNTGRWTETTITNPSYQILAYMGMIVQIYLFQYCQKIYDSHDFSTRKTLLNSTGTIVQAATYRVNDIHDFNPQCPENRNTLLEEAIYDFDDFVSIQIGGNVGINSICNPSTTDKYSNYAVTFSQNMRALKPTT